MVQSGEGTKRSHLYELGHSDREPKRLETRAQLVDPMTRRFLKDAGVNAGMRVLDILGVVPVMWPSSQRNWSVTTASSLEQIDRRPPSTTAAAHSGGARREAN
jgi:hypothetical protein